MPFFVGQTSDLKGHGQEIRVKYIFKSIVSGLNKNLSLIFNYAPLMSLVR
jgi:hypothetical protein